MRAELEAALATSFSRANLAVYADYLQTIDDPRGEWIAFELALVRDGVTAAAQQRREQLVRPFAPYFHPKVAYGFAYDVQFENAEKVTGFDASPIAPYLRSAWISPSYPSPLLETVETFASAPRPWLYRLGITLPDRNRMAALTIAPENRRDLADVLGAQLTARLLAATPNLEWLVLGGGIAGFAAGHPRLVHSPVTGALRIAPVTKVWIRIGGEPPESLELGRLQRHHAGVIDDLGDAARDAWADLRFAIEELESFAEEPLVRSFPAGTLAQVIASIDRTTYYGRDFEAIAAKLGRYPELDRVELFGRS